MPKSLPNNLLDLRVPNPRWAYLDQAHLFPFQDQAAGLSLINAWWLMELCFLVYIPDLKFVHRVLEEAEFSGVKAITRSSNHVLVIRDPKKLIVCFRGTLLNNLDNLLTDAKIARTSFDELGKVHRGFLSALDTLWPDLQNELKTHGAGRDIWFTGHSLGGALAILAAARWAQPSRLYTFGAPRVGNRTFQDATRKQEHFRFVHDHDVVCQLPPPLGYHHVGSVVHLRRNGIIEDGTNAWRLLKDNVTARIPALVSKIRASGGIQEALLSENAFTDHCPISYAIRLWNLIET